MYCGACGLGELLDLAHQSNSMNVQQVVTNWDTWQAGGISGSNWLGFQEAVRLGWVPNTQEGFRAFDWYWSQGGDAKAHLPELYAWMLAFPWAEQGRYHPDQLGDVAARGLSSINAGVSNGYLTAAERDAAVDAFNSYWPQYAAQFGIPLTGWTPIASQAGAIHNPVNGVDYSLDQVGYYGPNPASFSGGPEIMLQLTNGNAWTWAGTFTGTVIGTPQVSQGALDAAANQAAYREAIRQQALTYFEKVDYVIRPSLRNDGTYVTIAQRHHYHASDGTEKVDPWIVYNPATSFPLSDWQSGVVGGQQLSIERLILRDSLSDAEWNAILADAAASGVAPQPEPIPYIPGSQVYVPAPGTGGTTTIVLPGTTTPVPVSSLTPEQIAQETASQGAQYQPVSTPGAVTGPAPAPSTPGSAAGVPTSGVTTIAPGSVPGYYAAPGGPYVSPVQPSPEASEVPIQRAGLGSGLLIGGGILAAVFFLGRGKGRRH